MTISKISRRNVFLVLLISCILASIVQTALNTALTPIMQEMNISASTAQWLASSYSLVMGVMVLATAFLIRRYPSRPLYLCFMTVFSLGLFLSAMASTFYVLLMGRILQAIGCGLLMSLTQVIILSVYPTEERGSVMGIYGLAVCAAPVLAPTLSGIIIDLFGWHMIFWGTFILSIIVLAVGFIVMKNITHTEAAHFDIVSFVLCATGFICIVLGLGNWSKGSLFSITAFPPIIAGAVCLTLFSRRQLKMEKPFLDISTFSNKEFRLSVILSMLIYCVMMAVSTLLPLYSQSIRGFSATTSGLITMPGSLVTANMSPIAGKLYDKIGIRKIYIAGSSCIALGHFAMCFLSLSTPPAMVAALFILRQIGVGVLLMTTVTWGMSTLDKKNTSDGTAIISSLRTVAGAAGSAVFVSIMTKSAVSNDSAAMIRGLNVAFAGITVLSIIILVLALFKVGIEGKN